MPTRQEAASPAVRQEVPRQQQGATLRDSAGEWESFLQRPQQEDKSSNSTPQESPARQTPSATDSCRSMRGGGRNVRGSIDMGEALGVPGLLKARHVGYDSLQVGSLLGRGSFGKVYKGAAGCMMLQSMHACMHACAVPLSRHQAGLPQELCSHSKPLRLLHRRALEGRAGRRQEDRAQPARHPRQDRRAARGQPVHEHPAPQCGVCSLPHAASVSGPRFKRNV